MSADMHQPRDENGQFVSIGTLVERERKEHAKVHEQEHIVAKETAQRLEREVEQTAVRLEQAGELTAVRLEKGVDTALRAVGATAVIHAEAHNKEHVAHERIHAVEESNRDKASRSIDKRLDGMNEFRDALSDQNSRFVQRDYYDARHVVLDEKINSMEKRMAYYAGAAAVIGAGLAAFLSRVFS